jgi:hypothetical protein
VADHRKNLPRLLALAVAGAALIGLLVAFFLLYLRLPAGWSPIIGTAPAIGAVFLDAFPYPTVSLGPRAFRIAALTLVLAAWAFYGVIVLVLSRMVDPAARARALRLVIILAAVGHVLLVLMPPVLSTDLFRYALFGRMVTVYDLNPYATQAHALSGDPLWQFAGWRHLRSHYGATFVWLSALTTWLGGPGPIGTAIAFKGLSAVFNGVACWGTWRLARETGGRDGLVPLALYAFNPLVLIEGPGSGHPDSVMLALALVGTALWWRGRTTGGWVLLVASAAVKYMTGLLAVLLAVHAVTASDRGKRLALVARLAAVAAAVLLVLYGPFLGGAGVFGTALQVVMRGRTLEQGRELEPDDTPTAALAIFGALLAGALVIGARASRHHLIELTVVLVSFFVLFALRWWMPWYFLTGLALAIAAAPTPTSRILRPLTLLLAFLASLLYCALVPVAA